MKEKTFTNKQTSKQTSERSRTPCKTNSRTVNTHDVFEYTLSYSMGQWTIKQPEFRAESAIFFEFSNIFVWNMTSHVMSFSGTPCSFVLAIAAAVVCRFDFGRFSCCCLPFLFMWLSVLYAFMRLPVRTLIGSH